MKEFEYKIKDGKGIYVDTAGKLADKADNFHSKVVISKGKDTADVTRIISLLSLRIKSGDVVRIAVSGGDEMTAASEIKEFFCVNL